MMIQLSQLNIADTNDGKPKYKRLAESLEEWICVNRLSPGDKLPSDRQMVEQLGITSVTIGRALGELMSKGLLERRVGSGTYVAQKPKKSLDIGFFSEEPILDDSSFITGILAAMTDYWRANNGTIRHFICPEEEFAPNYRKHKLDGCVALLASQESVREVEKMIAEQIPCVTLGYRRKEFPNHSFGTNHEEAMIDAVTYLAQHGHKRIGILLPHHITLGVEMRQKSYFKGMWENALPVNPEWIYSGINWNDKVSLEKFRASLTGENHPDALIFCLLGLVMPFYTFAQNARIRIPEDISLIGFDDPVYVQHLNPPLTVFSQNIAQYTEAAMMKLHALIEKRSCPDYEGRDFQLIERKSVKARK